MSDGRRVDVTRLNPEDETTKMVLPGFLSSFGLAQIIEAKQLLFEKDKIPIT